MSTLSSIDHHGIRLIWIVVLVLLASRLRVETENALEAESERAAEKYHALYEAGVFAPEEE